MQRDDDMKAFLLVVRQALLLICAWIEKRYDLANKAQRKQTPFLAKVLAANSPELARWYQWTRR